MCLLWVVYHGVHSYFSPYALGGLNVGSSKKHSDG
jgi:hypothetical protein